MLATGTTHYCRIPNKLFSSIYIDHISWMMLPILMIVSSYFITGSTAHQIFTSNQELMLVNSTENNLYYYSTEYGKSILPHNCTQTPCSPGNIRQAARTNDDSRCFVYMNETLLCTARYGSAHKSIYGEPAEIVAENETHIDPTIPISIALDTDGKCANNISVIEKNTRSPNEAISTQECETFCKNNPRCNAYAHRKDPWYHQVENDKQCTYYHFQKQMASSLQSCSMLCVNNGHCKGFSFIPSANFVLTQTSQGNCLLSSVVCHPSSSISNPGWTSYNIVNMTSECVLASDGCVSKTNTPDSESYTITSDGATSSFTKPFNGYTSFALKFKDTSFGKYYGPQYCIDNIPNPPINTSADYSSNANIVKANTLAECETKCFERNGCTFFSFHADATLCLLTNSSCINTLYGPDYPKNVPHIDQNWQTYKFNTIAWSAVKMGNGKCLDAYSEVDNILKAECFATCAQDSLCNGYAFHSGTSACVLSKLSCRFRVDDNNWDAFEMPRTTYLRQDRVKDFSMDKDTGQLCVLQQNDCRSNPVNGSKKCHEMHCFDGLGEPKSTLNPQRCNKNALKPCSSGNWFNEKHETITKFIERVRLELACLDYHLTNFITVQEVLDSGSDTNYHNLFDRDTINEYRGRLLEEKRRFEDQGFQYDSTRVPKCTGYGNCLIHDSAQRLIKDGSKFTYTSGYGQFEKGVVHTQGGIQVNEDWLCNKYPDDVSLNGRACTIEVENIENCTHYCKQTDSCQEFSFTMNAVPSRCIVTHGLPNEFVFVDDADYKTYTIAAEEPTVHDVYENEECNYPASSIQSVHHSGSFTTLSEPNSVFRPIHTHVTDDENINRVLAFYSDMVFATKRPNIHNRHLTTLEQRKGTHAGTRCELFYLCENHMVANTLYNRACINSVPNSNRWLLNSGPIDTIGFVPGPIDLQQVDYTLNTVKVISKCVQLANDIVVCDYSERGRLADFEGQIRRVCTWENGQCVSSGDAMFSPEWFVKCSGLNEMECSRDALWHEYDSPMIRLKGTLLDANDHGFCIKKQNGRLFCQHKDISKWEYYPPKINNVNAVSLMSDKGVCALYNNESALECWGMYSLTQRYKKC